MPNRTATTWPSRTSRAILRDIEAAQRLRDLPATSALLLAGLYNDENDPTILFDGLRFDEVTRVAERSADVRAAFALLHAPQPHRSAEVAPNRRVRGGITL